jgi:hypothetical protein
MAIEDQGASQIRWGLGTCTALVAGVFVLDYEGFNVTACSVQDEQPLAVCEFCQRRERCHVDDAVSGNPHQGGRIGRPGPGFEDNCPQPQPATQHPRADSRCGRLVQNPGNQGRDGCGLGVTWNVH